MKNKRILIIISILILVGLLSACSGATANPTSWPGVTVDLENETVYVANNQHVYAVNLSNGSEKWRFPQEADNKISFFAAPALTEDDQLVVGGYNNILYSIDPTSGSQFWAYEDATDKFIAGSLASDQQVYAPNSDNQLYTISLSGQEKWKFQTEGALWGTPAVNGDQLYVSSMDHRVYALNKATGELIWQTDDLGGAIAGSPTLSSNGVLYAGTFGNELIALDVSDGRELWRVSTNNWVWSGPAIEEDVLYFGDLSGTMYAVNATDGAELWKTQLETAGSSDQHAITNAPLVAEGTVYAVTNTGMLWALDAATGTTRWSKPVGGRLYTSPVIAGDTILIAAVDADAVLYAFDLSGAQKWQFIPVK